jgi:hypothetical protein
MKTLSPVSNPCAVMVAVRVVLNATLAYVPDLKTVGSATTELRVDAVAGDTVIDLSRTAAEVTVLDVVTWEDFTSYCIVMMQSYP